jgi:hypothetical protein
MRVCQVSVSITFKHDIVLRRRQQRCTRQIHTHRSRRQHVIHSHSTGERAQQRSMFTITPPFPMVVELRTPLSCLSTQGHRRRVRTMSHGLHLLVLVSRAYTQCESSQEVKITGSALSYTSLSACAEYQPTRRAASQLVHSQFARVLSSVVAGALLTQDQRTTQWVLVTSLAPAVERLTCNPRVLLFANRGGTACIPCAVVMLPPLSALRATETDSPTRELERPMPVAPTLPNSRRSTPSCDTRNLSRPPNLMRACRHSWS